MATDEQDCAALLDAMEPGVTLEAGMTVQRIDTEIAHGQLERVGAQLILPILR
jgi:hypothetical protein